MQYFSNGEQKQSPLLSGVISDDDIITDRKIKSNKVMQMNLF